MNIVLKMFGFILFFIAVVLLIGEPTATGIDWLLQFILMKFVSIPTFMLSIGLLSISKSEE